MIDLGPGGKSHDRVVYGGENLIVLQMSGCVTRLPRLEELNPSRSRTQAMRQIWPGQFEQYLKIGPPAVTPKLEVVSKNVKQDAGGGEARFELKAKDFPASANVTYRWEKDSPVLRKFVEVKNLNDKPHRLLNVRLGTYRTDAKTSDGEQGFPVYLNDEFFMSLAHPSGWAIGDGGVVKLRHYPGVSIAPGKTFACMETVLGVSPAGARAEAIPRLRPRPNAACRSRAYRSLRRLQQFRLLAFARRDGNRGLVCQKHRKSPTAQPRPPRRKPKSHRANLRLLRYRVLVRSRLRNDPL